MDRKIVGRTAHKALFAGKQKASTPEKTPDPAFISAAMVKKEFSVRTGTVMERSYIPLQKWRHAMYLLATERKGIFFVAIIQRIRDYPKIGVVYVAPFAGSL